MATRSRRGLLKMLGGAIGGAIGVALGVPAALMVSWPARRRTIEETVVGVGTLASLPEGAPVRRPVRVARRLDAWTAYVDVLLGAVWLVRRGDSVTAFSTVCPHAGCAVDWDAQAGAFQCPCHGSRFSVQGQCVGGPAPRGLDRLETTVKEGQVQVTYRRYRPGMRARVPA